MLDETYPLETHKILQHYQKMCNRQFYNNNDLFWMLRHYDGKISIAQLVNTV